MCISESLCKFPFRQCPVKRIIFLVLHLSHINRIHLIFSFSNVKDFGCLLNSYLGSGLTTRQYPFSLITRLLNHIILLLMVTKTYSRVIFYRVKYVFLFLFNSLIYNYEIFLLPKNYDITYWYICKLTFFIFHEFYDSTDIYWVTAVI